MLELLDYLLGGLLQKELVKPPHCKACHARTTLTGKPRLFLLPLWQDQAEDLSAEFYLRGCRPISGANPHRAAGLPGLGGGVPPLR